MTGLYNFMTSCRTCGWLEVGDEGQRDEGPERLTCNSCTRPGCHVCSHLTLALLALAPSCDMGGFKIARIVLGILDVLGLSDPAIVATNELS